MEGKKVLWVVFSIALALVVILAAGLFLLRPRLPKSSEVPGTATPSTPSLQGYDPYEYVRGTSAPPGLTPPTGSQPQVIVVGEPPASQTAPGPTPPAAQPGPAGQGQALPEQVPPERAGAATAAPPERAAASTAAKPAEPLARPPQERVSTTPKARGPQERVGTTPKARAPQERAIAGAARAPTRQKAVSVTEYWIQAGSFSSAARADEVGRRLEERGLAPRTTTRDLNGKTHFRVRVGPYASRAEAEKFLGWIRELKGFETSYISMVASRRSMP